MRQVKFGGALGIVFALCIVAPCLPISLASQQSVLAQTNQDRVIFHICWRGNNKHRLLKNADYGFDVFIK